MERTADYTIQGFIYQFNRTLIEILKDEKDSTISVEGIIEDIEVSTPQSIEAIQCKYHESVETFTLSKVYKPILQMMEHFYDNKNKNIKYKLYSYFPNEDCGETYEITETHILNIFKSTDRKYERQINKLNGMDDIKGFIDNFTFEFGAPLSEIVEEVKESLINSDLSHELIDELFYPNAIQIIADLSIIHDAEQRKVNKTSLIKKLTMVDPIVKTHIFIF